MRQIVHIFVPINAALTMHFNHNVYHEKKCSRTNGHSNLILIAVGETCRLSGFRKIISSLQVSDLAFFSTKDDDDLPSLELQGRHKDFIQINLEVWD